MLGFGKWDFYLKSQARRGPGEPGYAASIPLSSILAAPTGSHDLIKAVLTYETRCCWFFFLLQLKSEGAL